MNKADFSYQKPAIEKVWNLLHNNQSKHVVFASVVGSGKSFMAKDIIEKYLKTYNGKVVFLAHNQNVLKQQFMEVIADHGNYEYGSLGSDSRVQVGLPPWFRKNKIENMDFLIIDEAHEYYGESMVQDIISSHNPKFVLLLTGTPGKFNGNNKYLFHYISGDQMMERDVYSGVDIDMVSVSSKKISDKMFLAIDRINEKMGKDPEKVMVICKDTKQARQAYKFLKDNNYEPALSTDKDDKDSLQIARFRKNKNCKALIVVRRGILGFSCPAMDSMIDLRASHNLDVVFQAIARIFRKHPEITEKYYVRVVHPRDWNKHLDTLHKVVGLLNMNKFKTYKSAA